MNSETLAIVLLSLVFGFFGGILSTSRAMIARNVVRRATATRAILSGRTYHLGYLRYAYRLGCDFGYRTNDGWGRYPLGYQTINALGAIVGFPIRLRQRIRSEILSHYYRIRSDVRTSVYVGRVIGSREGIDTVRTYFVPFAYGVLLSRFERIREAVERRHLGCASVVSAYPSRVLGVFSLLYVYVVARTIARYLQTQAEPCSAYRIGRAIGVPSRDETLQRALAFGVYWDLFGTVPDPDRIPSIRYYA